MTAAVHSFEEPIVVDLVWPGYRRLPSAAESSREMVAAGVQWGQRRGGGGAAGGGGVILGAGDGRRGGGGVHPAAGRAVPGRRRSGGRSPGREAGVVADRAGVPRRER